MMTPPKETRLSWHLALPVLFSLLLGWVPAALAKPNNDTLRCFDSLMKGARAYAVEASQAITKCELVRLESLKPKPCSEDSRQATDLNSAADRFVKTMAECVPGRLAAICPFESKNIEGFASAVDGPDQSLETRFVQMIGGSFAGGLLPGCPAPPGRAPTLARECGKAVSAVWKEVVDDTMACLFECELRVLKRDEGELCVDVSTGVPIDGKLNECLTEVAEDALPVVNKRCSAVALRGLGCPMTATTPAEASQTLVGDVLGFSEWLNLKSLHSTCRSDTETTVPVAPAVGMLRPSATRVTVACGATLDAAFFGNDTSLVLGSTINCDAAREETNGIVVSAPNVTIDGQQLYGLNGPDVDTSRTGAGIVLAAGADGVRLTGLKNIRNFAIGVDVKAHVSGVTIEDLSVRRNTVAGIFSRGSDIEISRVYADRNGISFDLQGDDVMLAESTARRSELAGLPSVIVEGEDINHDGFSVRVVDNLIESNKSAGLQARGTGIRIRDNRVLRGRGHGIIIEGDSNTIENNFISDNRGGHGIWVRGRSNVIQRNRSEKSGLSGFQIDGISNEIFFNEAGAPTGGTGNLQDGFVLSAGLCLFGGNVAVENKGVCFDLHSTTVNLGANGCR